MSCQLLHNKGIIVINDECLGLCDPFIRTKFKHDMKDLNNCYTKKYIII